MDKQAVDSRFRSRRRAIGTLLALILGALPTAGLGQQDWYVDSSAPGCPATTAARRATGDADQPFCTIQEAVDSAVNGDTIHIAPGTYFENVLLEKDLTLIGTGGREITMLDGMTSGSVVQVRDSAVSLIGLTLTNGTGTTVSRYDPYGELAAYGPYGGGLFADSPSNLKRPTVISSCAIEGNTAYCGGGVASPTGAVPITLLNSSVSANTAMGWGGGGAFAVYLTATESVFAGNEMGSSYNQGRGGAIAAGFLTMTGCHVKENRASIGGGIWCVEGRVADTAVTDNAAPGLPTTYVGNGSGIVAIRELVLENSTVTSKEVGRGSIWIDGHFSDDATLMMTNSTVGSGGGYGAVQLSSNSSIGSTGHTQARITNSILFGDAGYFASIRLRGPASSAIVEHTLIEDGWPGIGNIDADPRFVDPMNGDYRLSPSSPAIDAGDNTAVPMGIATDIRGAPRIINGTVDMGAYEFFQRRQRANVPVETAPPRVIR